MQLQAVMNHNFYLLWFYETSKNIWAGKFKNEKVEIIFHYANLKIIFKNLLSAKIKAGRRDDMSEQVKQKANK